MSFKRMDDLQTNFMRKRYTEELKHTQDTEIINDKPGHNEK